MHVAEEKERERLRSSCLVDPADRVLTELGDSGLVGKEPGLYTVYATNGYASREHLDLIGPYLDAWRVDLKGFSRTPYKRISGIAREIGERTPWHLTRFFPSADLAHLPATRVSALERAREIGLEEGLA